LWEMEQINDPHRLDPADPHNLQDAEEPVLERIEIATEGENCDECVRKLREPLLRIRGVQDVRVNTDSERVVVTFDARRTHVPELHDAILRSGYKPGAFAS
jgi:copper chaperone CopZ